MIRLELLRLIVDNSQYFVGWVPELVMLFLLRDQRFVTKCDRGTKRGGGVSFTPKSHVVYYTQGDMTSQNLWPRYNRHFLGMTWHNVWS